MKNQGGEKEPVYKQIAVTPIVLIKNVKVIFIMIVLVCT